MFQSEQEPDADEDGDDDDEDDEDNIVIIDIGEILKNGYHALLGGNLYGLLPRYTVNIKRGSTGMIYIHYRNYIFEMEIFLFYTLTHRGKNTKNNQLVTLHSSMKTVR